MLQNVGILHRRTQQWDLALKFFHKAQQIDPSFCDVEYWIGLTLLNSGKIWPSLTSLRIALQCIYSRNNAASALQRIYAALMESSPNNVTIAIEWASILGEVGQHDVAAKQLLQAGIVLGSSPSSKPRQIYDVLLQARKQHRLAFPTAETTTMTAQSGAVKKSEAAAIPTADLKSAPTRPPPKADLKTIVAPSAAMATFDKVASQPEPCELSFALGMRQRKCHVLAEKQITDIESISHTVFLRDSFFRRPSCICD